MSELIKSGSTLPKFAPKLTGLAARKAEADKAAALAKLHEATSSLPKVKTPSDYEHRIGIIYDDSLSMGHAQMEDAAAGTEEFLRSCAKDTTAVALYPMNASPLILTENLPAVAIFAKGLRATGGTPLIARLEQMIKENRLTRAIVFSDGEPAHKNISDEILQARIAVDTVYIPDGYVNGSAKEFMQNLAAKTDGIYLQFERGKSNFRTAFKYLSPGLRYMLTDRAFVDRLEGK